MSELRKVWKLLLEKEFYNKHKNSLPVTSFDQIGQDLLSILEIGHSKFNRNLTTDDLFLLYIAENPTLTTANKNTIEVYLANIKSEPDIGEDIADVVYASLWKKEVGRYVAEYGTRLADGQHDTVDGLVGYLSSIHKSFIPEDITSPVNLDPIGLFTKLNERGKWLINIPQLNQRIKYISPGQFIVLLARPECGKTATIVNLIAGKEGFAAQGANTHLLANEESAEVTAGRAVCCFNEQSFMEVKANPELGRTEGWEIIRRNLTFVHKPDISLSQLENYIKKHRPDVIVVDQIDHLGISGSYEKGHEKLGAIYRRTRELASMYECVIIGVCQASAEGEGSTRINFSMAEGSKTSKAAAADLIIGIGKKDQEEDGDQVLRYFTVSKNKISGWHGVSVCKLIQSQSRLIA